VCFLKFNDNNICIDNFKDHISNFKISEQIINQQKLNNNLKEKPLMICLPGHLKLFILNQKNADIESLTTQDVKLIKRNYYL
jgi:hypothetical protein